MKWLPLFLGVGLGIGVGVIYLTQFDRDEEEWAYAPSRGMDAHVDDFYDMPVLQEELILPKENKQSLADSLLSEDDLAALLEQEQAEVD